MAEPCEDQGECMLTSNNTSALKDKNLETAEDQMPNDSKGEGSLDSDKPILKES